MRLWQHLIVLSGVLEGCGPRRVSTLDDAVFLAAGVDPRSEMDAIARSMESLGRLSVARVDTEDFSAAAFEGGAVTELRVTSRRGIVLALTSDEQHALALDPRTGRDLDGDTRPDLLASSVDPLGTCMALGHVTTAGQLRWVETDHEGLEGARCIEELVDRDHDGRVEGLTRVRAAALEAILGRAPALPVALALTDNGFVRADPAQQRGALLRERARITRTLSDLTPSERLLAAIELAWIADALGDAVVDVLESARAFELDPEVRAWLESTLVRLRQGASFSAIATAANST